MLILLCIDQHLIIPMVDVMESLREKNVYDQAEQIAWVVHWVRFQSKYSLSSKKYLFQNKARILFTKIFVLPGIETGALNKRKIHVSISRTSCSTRLDVHSHV